jgi:gliding motility-associated-like protein
MKKNHTVQGLTVAIQKLFVACDKQMISIHTVAFCFLLSTGSFAQYTKLLDMGSAGENPLGSLYSDGTFLYGTTSAGGSNNFGTLFKINPDGTGHSILLHFNSFGNGRNPTGSLISDGTFLYGMTKEGGSLGLGTLFKITPTSGSYTKLLDFDGANGSLPTGDLLFDGTFLYGLTSAGGVFDFGTIFKIKPDGTDYQKLLDFDDTNGRGPNGSLIFVGSFLYGMTLNSTIGSGVMFKIMPDGTGFGIVSDLPNGDNPYGSLLFDGTFLFGMTYGGGNDDGIIFKLKPDGSEYSTVMEFNGIAKGAGPFGSLISDGTSLYGMTRNGGSGFAGTVFKIAKDGTGHTKLIDFTGAANGRSPYGSLIFDGTFLYGLTSEGGADKSGTLFKVKPDGTDFNKVFDFYGSGNFPSGGLISDGTFVYGVTTKGGVNNLGTIFKMLPDGKAYSTLYDFDISSGTDPLGALYFDGTFLYGMTGLGGSSNVGTIFKIMPDGTNFIKLYDFDITTGRNPLSALISDGTFLYGMTPQGGAGNRGVIFKIMPDGTGYTLLSELSAPGAGSSPNGNLLYDGFFLYGATRNGGANGVGTIFKLLPDGTGYTTLIDFNGAGNGSRPTGSLISDGTFLYGTTNFGGINDQGVIFKILADGSGYTKLFEFDQALHGREPVGELALDGTNFYGLTRYDVNNNPGSLYTIKTDGTGFATLVSFGLEKGEYPTRSLLKMGTAFFGTTSNGGLNNRGTVFKYIPTVGPSITITTQPTDAITCDGATATFTTAATGTTNIAFQWQFSTTLRGTYSDIANGSGYSNATTSTLSVNTTGNFGVGFYRCKVNGDNAATVFTDAAELTVNALPTAPTVTGASNCGAGSVSLGANGGAAGQYRWYDAATGRTAIAGQTNAVFTTPSLTATTTYHVAINNGTCESTRTAVAATINPIPPAPATTGATVCSGSTAILNASGGTNGQYRWYTDATTTTPISGQTNATFTTASLTATTTYYVSINNGACENTRTAVTATINPLPSAPTTTGATTCRGNSATLNASGGTNGQYRWYSDVTTTTPIAGQTNATFTTPSLTATTTYHVAINNGTCESGRAPVTATVSGACNQPPVINATAITVRVQGSATINLAPLLSDPDNNLTLASLRVAVQPTSGAKATIEPGQNLRLDYTGINFSGTDQLTIEACDLSGACSQRELSVEVEGEMIAYNAVSPGGDGKNDVFLLEHIGILQMTKDNKVTIFNRWGDVVFDVENYDNDTRVFRGLSNDGKELPSGVYFYRIVFGSGAKSVEGFISLRR